MIYYNPGVIFIDFFRRVAASQMNNKKFSLHRITIYKFRIVSAKTLRSSRNSTGSASCPYSHIMEKNHIPLSPMQKSAGVKVILESRGGSVRCGLYSAGHPNASPFQGFLAACNLCANFLTSSRSGMRTGITELSFFAVFILTLAVTTFP